LISTGTDILSAKVMGADYAYVGTRFIAAEESSAFDDYKQMVIIDAHVNDVLYTDALSGVHANVLIPSLIKEGINPETIKSKEEIDLTHLVDVKAWRDLWSAGQGVTTVKERETTKQIIEALTDEYEASIEKIKSKIYINYLNAMNLTI